MQGPRVQGPGYKGAGVQGAGVQGAGVQRGRGAGGPGYNGAGMQGDQDAGGPGFRGPGVQEGWGTGGPGCREARVQGAGYSGAGVQGAQRTVGPGCKAATMQGARDSGGPGCRGPGCRGAGVQGAGVQGGQGAGRPGYRGLGYSRAGYGGPGYKGARVRGAGVQVGRGVGGRVQGAQGTGPGMQGTRPPRPWTAPAPRAPRCPCPHPPGGTAALTAEHGGPPGARPAARMRALAGELGEAAADAGGAQRAPAAVLHAGLHVQLQRHQAQAVLEGRACQQPLALGALADRRRGEGMRAAPALLFSATPPDAPPPPPPPSRERLLPRQRLTCSEQDSPAGSSSGSSHTAPGFLIFCMFPNSMALKDTPGGAGLSAGQRQGPSAHAPPARPPRRPYRQRGTLNRRAGRCSPRRGHTCGSGTYCPAPAGRGTGGR